jgi:GNAT superfamily N-acetyltransferase
VRPVVVEWGCDQLAARVDDVLDVYAAAMGVPPASARSRRSVLIGHLDRAGLRAVAALDGDRLVGIGYGYLGAPGQWWHDQVRAALTLEQVSTWLADAFEVCELHVLPALHGTGLGRDVLLRVLAGTTAGTAVLTTPDQETRARRFYRDGGWVDLVRDLHFPGDPRSFAVLGLHL